jgi:transcriptional regulator with XRE-family HTH domain
MADMDPATLNRLEQGKGNPNLRTLERVAAALGVEVADFFPKEMRRSSLEPSLFNGGSEEERGAEETPSIADDKRWLAVQQRRGVLSSLEIAGASVNPQDLPDEIAAFIARDLRHLLQNADITLGNRIESTIRLFDNEGREILVHARAEAA